MSKIGLVAEQQFKKDVFKRSFLLAIVAMPIFLGFIIGMGWLGERLQQENTQVGYVDAGQVLTQAPASPDANLQFIRFATAAEARAALEAGQIDSYYLLPADYPHSREVALVHSGQPNGAATQILDEAIRRTLLANQPEQVVERALAGPALAVLAIERQRTVPVNFPGLGAFVPLLLAALFAFLIMTVAATLMEAMAAEKQNRTVEIVVSSISPGQMMAGKILGVMGMALLLAVSWLAILLGFAWLGANVLQWSWLQNVAIDGRDVTLLLLVALPSFLCLAALMVALGATLVEVQEAQQIGGLAFMVLFMPIYLFVVFGNNPDSPLAIAFSLFPPTAVTTLAVRSIFMQVPTAQFLAAALIALVSSVVLIWLAGKLFRANMLRYGQGLRLKQLLRGRSRQDDGVTG
jgi:ABC-2 type transport system permease protein